MESLNPWSGCMGSEVSGSLEQKGLLGLPVRMDLRFRDKGDKGTIGPRLDSSKPQDERSLAEKAHFWGRKAKRERHICLLSTSSQAQCFSYIVS